MKRLRVSFLMLLMVVAFASVAQKRFGGMTLYTVRDAMGEDPKATLKAVSDIGYKYIEAVNYEDGKFYGMTPAEFKKELKRLDLEPLSVHMGAVTLETADQMIADVKAAGFKYFIAPVPPMGMFSYDRESQSLTMTDDVEKLTSVLDEIGRKCEAAGLEFLYHNHNFEFEENANGIVPIDYMLENLDPKYVNFQMDLYWVTRAEADPLEYFERYPGRFKIWHVKDMDDEGRFAPVGEGNIDFASILAQKDKSGMKYYIVEQDRTFDGMEPMEAIRISYDALKEIGFK